MKNAKWADKEFTCKGPLEAPEVVPEVPEIPEEEALPQEREDRAKKKSLDKKFPMRKKPPKENVDSSPIELEPEREMKQICTIDSKEC